MHGDHIGCLITQTKSTRNKKCSVKISPEKLSFSGNFTPQHKHFNISGLSKRERMRQSILDSVMKRTENEMMEHGEDESNKLYLDLNPMYEDPRDVISKIPTEKPHKPPRKHHIQGVAVATKDRSLTKEQKRKLLKKYEALIMSLMERCEENVVQISEKDTYIAKLKNKLKAVLEYNKLFANENDQLKCDHKTLVEYIEECKKVVGVEKERNRDLEGRCKELEDRVGQYEGPDRDTVQTAIPMSCSSRQILLNQAKEHNCRLQKDMRALKDVLYRLNVQLSRYQERIRNSMLSECKTDEKCDGLDSLITASLGCKTEATPEEANSNKSGEDHSGRVVDLSGLLSAQALAPLFDAYQENLQEKDSLIQDYEKQFEILNKKSKQIVEENKQLNERVHNLDIELAETRQGYKKLCVEKETADIERATVLERAEKAESKLKEVYELYEDKIASMMRDYETVHREYFATKSALEQSENKMAQLDIYRSRTVPSDLHERRLQHCNRLLEELKHQYNMENERKSELITKLQSQMQAADERCKKVEEECRTVKEELKVALKNVRLYRRAAAIFRRRHSAALARLTRARARTNKHNAEPMKNALDTLEKIKTEIKTVKSKAHVSLEELERRIVEQEKKFTLTQDQLKRELERATVTLQHKEGIISSLIDKIAEIEDVRHYTARSRSASQSPETPQETTVKLVPGSGGYFREKEGKRRGQL